MRRYSSSKVRIVLFVVLIGAILLSAGGGYAQSTLPAETAAAAKPGMFSTLFGLIMENRDPIFFTILACSILAVTLIIKSFLQVRSSVMLPPDSIEAIRQLIVHRKYNELLAFTQNDDSFVSKALNPALKTRPGFCGDEGGDGDRHRRADRRAVPQDRVPEHHRQPRAAAGPAGHGAGHDRGVRRHARGRKARPSG